MLGIEHVVLRLSAAMFGSSGHTQRPAGLVTDQYLGRNHSRNSDQHKVDGVCVCVCVCACACVCVCVRVCACVCI